MENETLREEIAEEALTISKRYELESIMNIWEKTFISLLK